MKLKNERLFRTSFEEEDLLDGEYLTYNGIAKSFGWDYTAANNWCTWAVGEHKAGRKYNGCKEYIVYNDAAKVYEYYFVKRSLLPHYGWEHCFDS